MNLQELKSVCGGLQNAYTSRPILLTLPFQLCFFFYNIGTKLLRITMVRHSGLVFQAGLKLLFRNLHGTFFDSL